MTATPTPARGGLLTDSARVEAFSDGVFAIAITLLVLDLHPPHQPGQVGAELLAQGPTYLAYLAAFLTIGIVWINHHVVFTTITRVDPALLWINLALLGTSSVLPFPTAVLADALQDGTSEDRVAAVGLYAGVSILQAGCWLLLYRHLHRHPELLGDPDRQQLFTGEQARAVLGAALYLAVAALALIAPTAAAVIILALPVFYGATSHGLAVRARSTQATTAGEPPG